MTTWFITRHPGALEWAARRNLRIDRQLAHLDPALVAAGDTVIGTLPIHLVARVCERGARYFNLSLDLPAAARGRELSADELEAYGARLEAYVVREQELVFIPTTTGVLPRPAPDLESLAGIARGADTSNIRDHEDRT